MYRIAASDQRNIATLVAASAYRGMIGTSRQRIYNTTESSLGGVKRNPGQALPSFPGYAALHSGYLLAVGCSPDGAKRNPG
jgi:hypothetical protein